jgi:hypothetical protein
MDKIYKNRYFQLIAALILGGVIGVVFYPTQSIERRTKERVEKEVREEERIEKKKLSEKASEERSKREEAEQSFRSLQVETTRKIETLSTENRQLRESSKKSRFKLVKPDGTIVEKEYEENNREEVTQVITQVREEFTQKVQQIENRWKKVYTERFVKIKEKHKEELSQQKTKYEKVLEEKETEEVIKVNEKKLRLEAGATSDLEYHVHGSYNVFGPISIGAGVQFRTDDFDDVSVGIGIDL